MRWCEVEVFNEQRESFIGCGKRAVGSIQKKSARETDQGWVYRIYVCEDHAEDARGRGLDVEELEEAQEGGGKK